VPALASVRAAFPQAEIDWFVQDDFVDAVRAHPALRAVVPFRHQQHAIRRGHFADLFADLPQLGQVGWRPLDHPEAVLPQHKPILVDRRGEGRHGCASHPHPDQRRPQLRSRHTHGTGCHGHRQQHDEKLVVAEQP
jgi:hypothetical protein